MLQSLHVAPTPAPGPSLGLPGASTVIQAVRNTVGRRLSQQSGAPGLSETTAPKAEPSTEVFAPAPAPGTVQVRGENAVEIPGGSNVSGRRLQQGGPSETNALKAAPSTQVFAPAPAPGTVSVGGEKPLRSPAAT